MKNPVLLPGLIALLFALACIAGCTTTGTTPSPATSCPVVQLTPAAVTGQNGTVSLLFVQEAQSGSLVPAVNGTWTLTLDGIVPYTLYFSDRPDRIAGFVTTDMFISNFTWSVPPNAAITIPGGAAGQDTMMVTLSNPQYDLQAKRLVYTAALLDDYKGDKLKELNAKAGRTLPATFGRASIFIDNGNSPLQKSPYSEGTVVFGQSGYI